MLERCYLKTSCIRGSLSLLVGMFKRGGEAWVGCVTHDLHRDHGQSFFLYDCNQPSSNVGAIPTVPRAPRAGTEMEGKLEFPWGCES